MGAIMPSSAISLPDASMRIIAVAKVSLLVLALVAGFARAATVSEAREWLDLKDTRAAAAIVALAKAEPKNADVKVLWVRILLQQGEVKKALDVAKDAVDLAPNNAQTHYWLGNAYGNRVGQVGMISKMLIAPKLRSAFEQAVALDPDLVDARNSLVDFYLQAPSAMGGSIDKAKAQVAQIATRDVALGHSANARLLLAEDKPEEALAEMEAAHAGKPEEKRYRLNLGLAYQQAEKWEQAFALFQAWVDEDEGASSAWYQLGRTSALSGLQVDTGIAALQHYLSVPIAAGQPEAQHAWFRLGQVFAYAGRKDEARSAFQKALELDSRHAEAKAALAKL
jgi:tetratricopeptide (TPR) repeat protein